MPIEQFNSVGILIEFTAYYLLKKPSISNKCLNRLQLVDKLQSN